MIPDDFLLKWKKFHIADRTFDKGHRLVGENINPFKIKRVLREWKFLILFFLQELVN